MMACRHPLACEVTDEDGETYCGWCQEASELRRDVKALTDQLEKKAIVVHDGGTVNVDGDVGYLRVDGGTVNMGQMTCTTVTANKAY